MMDGSLIYRQCYRYLLMSDVVDIAKPELWVKLTPEVLTLEEIKNLYVEDEKLKVLQYKNDLVLNIDGRFLSLGQVIFKLNRKKNQSDNQQLEVVFSSIVTGWQGIINGLITYAAELSLSGKSERTVFQTLNDAIS